MVGNRRPVRVGRHLQAHYLRAVQVDHHAVDAEDQAVARQWVFPGFQFGVADVGGGQVHFAHATPVVLKGGDLFRVGRPEQHRPVAL